MVEDKFIEELKELCKKHGYGVGGGGKTGVEYKLRIYKLLDRMAKDA